MENKDKIWLATHLGDKAYYKGLKRAFFDDSRAMELLDSNIELTKAEDYLDSVAGYLEGEQRVEKVDAIINIEPIIGGDFVDMQVAPMAEVKTDQHGNHQEAQFQKGDKVTYLGSPGEITGVNKEMTGDITYNVAYDKGTGRTKVTNVANKGNEIKAVKESELDEKLTNDMPHELAMGIMRAWYKGWDAANVEHNAPEPEGYKLKQL